MPNVRFTDEVPPAHCTARTRRLGSAAALGLALLLPAAARAAGSPENALLIVDPSNADSMYLANYYRAARDIPDNHLLYMEPGAANWTAFQLDNLDGLEGHFATTGIRDLVDYVIVAPTDIFAVSASGILNDTCSPVNRFSLSAVYTLAQIPEKITVGLTVTRGNAYFRNTNVARAFSSTVGWSAGQPTDAVGADRYFIGAQLGYLGLRGNSVSELINMIDRSVAADGTRPAGTIYYMTTTDTARSGPRDADYPSRVADLIADGKSAQNLNGVLPAAADCLGVMTGWASPDIDGAAMTLLPGAFCDHLTSYAATFDNASQTKLSRWIAKGASGSWGAVEEPCNYAGKFPNPRVHITYLRGLTLGEAALRGASYLPFQSLLYGDPLTRPFAYIPTVTLAGLPVGAASGTLILTPGGSTANPSATLLESTLIVDGRPMETVPFGGAFTLDTRQLSDGWHDLRVVTIDSSVTQMAGRWVGSLVVDNEGRNTSVVPGVTLGNLATPFGFAYSAFGSNIREVRLVHNGRVVAAGPNAAGTLTVGGLNLGAGPARVFAEAAIGGGRFVRSAPITLDITPTAGVPSGAAPTAFSYRKYVQADAPAVVELPAWLDDAAATPTYQIMSNPAQATLSTNTGAYRILRPGPTAEGVDTFTFRVQTSAGTSNTATVTVVYLPCGSDVDENGTTDLDDLLFVLGNFGATGATRSQGDLDGDGDVDLDDLLVVLGGLANGCP